MKKIAVIAAGLLSLGYLGAFEMPALGVNTSVKFSSEKVSRGRKSGKQIFMPKAEVGIPVFEKGKIYTGTSAKLELCSGTSNEVSPYIGMMYDITDAFKLDTGYTYYFYTNTPKEVNGIASGVKRNSREIYVGVMADMLLSPSAYMFYDFDAEEIAIEGRVLYSFDLTQYGVDGVSLDLGTKFGYDRANKPGACKNRILKDKDYVYYGLTADAVYKYNEHAKAHASISYEGNGASKGTWVNSSGHKNLVWFNASVDCSF